jgi:thymidylate kinase
MIFEFLGNSGAGKSTLIPILSRFLQDNGFTAMSTTQAIHHYMRKTYLGRVICYLAPPTLQGPILWRVFAHFIRKLYFVGFAVRNPRLVHYVVTSQLRRPIPWQHRRLILRLFFHMTGSYRFLKSRVRPDEILILDEGFVHRATHMFVSESEQPTPQQIVAYLKLLPSSDLVIWVQTPLDVCLARIQARGLQMRLRNLKAQDVAQFMTNVEQVVNITSQHLKTAGFQVIEVQNDGDLEACAAELQHSVRQFLSPVVR